MLLIFVAVSQSQVSDTLQSIFEVTVNKAEPLAGLTVRVSGSIDNTGAAPSWSRVIRTSLTPGPDSVITAVLSSTVLFSSYSTVNTVLVVFVAVSQSQVSDTLQSIFEVTVNKADPPTALTVRVSGSTDNTGTAPSWFRVIRTSLTPGPERVISADLSSTVTFSS